MQFFNHPPFPPLQWQEYRWQGSLAVPAWAEFRLGDSERPGGEVDFGVGTPNDEPQSPTPEQAAAFRFFVENDAQVRDAITAELLAQFPQWQENSGLTGDELEEFMPNVESVDGFKPLLELSGVHIFTASKEGCAYIGVTCDCEWDPEHDFGAMMHRDRVVEIGGAEVAIIKPIAEKDANSDAE